MECNDFIGVTDVGRDSGGRPDIAQRYQTWAIEPALACDIPSSYYIERVVQWQRTNKVHAVSMAS